MALNNFRSVNLKIDKANDYFISNQFAKEGDYNGRKLVVQLTNGGLIQDQTGVALNLGWQHQKVGNKGLDPFVAVDSTQGIFEIAYPAEMMQTGNVVAVIQVIESGKIVETRNFTIQVEASPIDESSVVSENSFTVLQNALLTVNKYDGRIANIENTKANSEDVIESFSAVDKTIDSFKQETNSQIASKVGNGKRATLNDLGEDILAAIEGGEGTEFTILSIPADKSVTPDKTNFFTNETTNYFDKANITPYNETTFYSNSITVVAGDVIRLYCTSPQTKHRFIVYGLNNTILEQIDKSGTTSYIEFTPSFDGILKCIVIKDEVETAMITKNYLPTLTNYIPYGLIFNESIASAVNKSIQEESITSDKLTTYIEGQTIDLDSLPFTNGYYINAGVPTALSGVSYSEPFRVNSGDPYHLTSDLKYPLSFYSSDVINSASYIGQIFNASALSTVFEKRTLTVPPEAAYAVINITNSTKASYGIEGIRSPAGVTTEKIEKGAVTPEKISSKWKGKTIDFIGDSLLAGIGASANSKRFANILGELTGAKINNYGLSSSKISNVPNDNVPSFVERMTSMDVSADLVIVFGGTNDYWHSLTDIGIETDTDTSTFYGALNTLMIYLRTTYVGKEVAFIFPFNQQIGGRNSDSNLGKGTFNDFRKAMINRCEYHGIPLLDLYSTSGMDMAHNEAHLNYFGKGYGRPSDDGVHLNDNGNYRAAKKMHSFIENL